LRTWRWSRQRPPRREVIAGSKGASRSHSWSVISNRRFTTGFYRTSCTRPKPTQPSEKHALVRCDRCFQDALHIGQVVLAVPFEGADEDGREQLVEPRGFGFARGGQPGPSSCRFDRVASSTGHRPGGDREGERA